MKLYPKIAVLLILLLCVSPLCVGQVPRDCDQLRSKIERLEIMDVRGMSNSIQQIYSETLGKLYAQLIPCLEQEIAVTAEMSNAVAGTDAANAVQDKLQALKKEKADTESKLTVVRTALNLRETGAQPGGNGLQPNSISRGNGDAVSSAIAAPPRAQHSSEPVEASTSLQVTFPCLPGEEYSDAPPLLTDIVGKAAGDVARGENDGDLSGVPQMMLYATLDAASPTSSELLRGLQAYQYLSETARTDKQLGGAASSNGAVSAIEKPGFASLLGFAVEHGAINKKTDGTNLTLSTSLYSLYVVNKENTAETYKRAGVLNRVGVAATFAIDNTTNDLANARRNNLAEWSVKARLFGDRSTRSAKFQKFWKEKITPLIDARLMAIGKPIDELTSGDAANQDYKILRRQGGNCLRDAVKNRKADGDYQAATEVERTKILNDVLLRTLKSNVYNRIKTGQLQLSDQIVTAIETRYVPNLKAALDDLTKAGGEVEKKLEDLQKAPLATFAYTNYRIPTGSDYSETKFLFEQDKGSFGPMKLIGNFGLSFYNRPNPALNQNRLRDITAALAFEGATNSPFTESGNQSKITYSFVGRYQRLYENEHMATRTPDIGTLQFVSEIPFIKGFSLPFSLTYANASEEERKKGFRFNFGMRMDTDKLLDLLWAKK